MITQLTHNGIHGGKWNHLYKNMKPIIQYLNQSTSADMKVYRYRDELRIATKDGKKKILILKKEPGTYPVRCVLFEDTAILCLMHMLKNSSVTQPVLKHEKEFEKGNWRWAKKVMDIVKEV